MDIHIHNINHIIHKLLLLEQLLLHNKLLLQDHNMEDWEDLSTYVFILKVS